ncbi:MAG: type II secretion system F family protein [Verrucomicrobiota bacterium]|nr:type II secretion system F family protein [Verrucomicrobiota bacterium]
MPQFVYAARSRAGEKVEGALEANDRRTALLQIEKLGYIPVSVQDRGSAAARPGAGDSAAPRIGRRRRMGGRDLLLFTTELSDLLASGMTLGNALNALAKRRSDSVGGAAVIAELRDEIVCGSSLSDAMSLSPRVFSKLYVNMIRAGEASGALGEVLKRLVSHYERVQETKDKVTMALVYPCIVLAMGLGTLVFSLVKVIPTFSAVFANMKTALPLPTRILIGASSWLLKYGWLAALVMAPVCILSWRALRTERGRLWRDRLLLKTPLLRGIVASGIFANFARTLETLLANGVPVLRALAIVEQTVGNTVIGREIRNARNRVTDGTTISGPLAAGKVFPPMMTDMLSVGEQTGDMCGALAHVSRRYESELERNLKIFTTALEPILIVVVAVMVGFVAISILMAVFRLTSGIGMA